MTLTRVRAEQIKGVPQLYAPRLTTLEPLSLIPNATNPLTIKGTFFTPDTTVSIDGQSVNSVEFINTTELKISVTTGSTEGNFDVTINNGKEASFKDAFIVGYGTILLPQPAEWTDLSGSPDIRSGEFRLSIFNADTSGLWSPEIDYTKDFALKLKIANTGLGDPYNYSQSSLRHTALVNVSDNSVMYSIRCYNSGSNFQVVTTNNTSGTVITDINRTLWWEGECNNHEYEYRFVNGTMGIYHNNTLIKTGTAALTQNVRLKIDIKTFNIVGLKYIQL